MKADEKCQHSTASVTRSLSLRNENDLQAGSLVDCRSLKKAGPYILGQILGNSPVKSVVQCLARKIGDSDETYYSIKILNLQDPNQETQDDKQGKMLLHTEFNLLSALKDQEGVIHHYGLFKDEAWEEKLVSTNGEYFNFELN